MNGTAVPVPSPCRHRDLRLTRSAEIRMVFQTGKRLNDPHLRLIYRKTDHPHPRICIQVSRKMVKRAVDRNRIRRRTREAFRPILLACNIGLDLVVQPRASLLDVPWPELVRRAGALVQSAAAA